MENNYELLVDACEDLPKEYIEKHNIHVQQMELNIDGKTFLRYYDDRELSPRDFMEMLASGKIAKTSQVSPKQWMEAATPILESGKDLFIMPFSSGLSGTYSSAYIALGMLKEQFKNRKIFLFDSKAASCLYSNVIDIFVQNKLKGMSLEDNISNLEKQRPNVNVCFTVDDLDTLIRGGRLSKVKGAFAKLLNIKPCLSMSQEGTLYVVNKAHGKSKALDYLFTSVKSTILNPEEQTVFITHTEAEMDAINLANRLKSELKIKDFVITSMSPIISAHTGPGTVAVSWQGNKFGNK